MLLSKHRTLIEDIDAAKAAGYSVAFFFRDGQIVCRESNQAYSEEDCQLMAYCGHEGMSDPGDASILFLIRCNDGLKGYLSSAYGPYSDTGLIDFVMSLKKADGLSP
jgi:hypothetical protein